MATKRLLAPIVMILFLTCAVTVAFPVQASTPKTFVVSPSGGDDTANIQGAFDSAVAAGPGSTVKLTAGYFYCSNIYVENFRGTFKGAGRDLTVVDTLRGIYPDAPGLVNNGFDFVPSLFCFRDGDIKIRDMTFDITSYSPAEPWILLPHPYYGTLTAAGDVIRIMGNTNSLIERVRFIGHEGDIVESWGEAYNIGWTILITGIWGYDPVTDAQSFEPVSGSHTVSECSFEYVCCLDCNYIVNGRLRITHNVFSGGIDGVAQLFNFVNSVVDFSCNQIDIDAWVGFLYASFGPYWGLLPANTLLLIHHNVFHVTGSGEAIDLWDYSGGKAFRAIVYDNDISMDTTWGGIAGPAHDVMIFNNRFTGTGLAGIYTGGWGNYPSSGWVIAGNKFQGFTPALADIWLDSAASKCIVVATKGTTVLDEGVNNIIVGAGR